MNANTLDEALLAAMVDWASDASWLHSRSATGESVSKANMLTVVRLSTEEETVRDLCRVREDAKPDGAAAKNSLT